MSHNTLPPLREVIREYQLSAEKKWGQHFLLDLNITDKIVRAAGDITNKTVLEVGPGPGGLTRSILKAKPKKLIAIEKDPRCITALNAYLKPQYTHLELIQNDALNTALQEPCTIIANLPYNIGTPLLINWLHQLPLISSMTLLLQKEVAERITAKVNTPAYGRLSILCQSFTETRIDFAIPASAFTPPPKVISAVVTLTPKKILPNISIEALGNFTQLLFSKRRKTLKTILKSHPNTLALLEQTKLDPQKRPQELTIDEIVQLVGAS